MDNLPERHIDTCRLKSRLMLGAVLVFCVLLLSRGMARPLDLYDEGVVLTGASQVARGLLPYRDFWTAYAPGQFLVVGNIFSYTEESIQVFRLYDLVIKLLIIILLGVAALRLCGSSGAAIAMGLATLWLERMGLPGYTVFPALAASLATLLLVDRRRYLTAGIFLATTAFFRHDFAVYLLVVLIVATLSDRKIVRSIVLGTFLIAAGVVILAGVVPASLLIESLVRFPLQVFPREMSLPFSTLLIENPVTTAVTLSPFLVLLSSVLAVPQPRGNLRMLLQLLSVGLILQIAVRSDIPHLLPLLLMTLPLLAEGLLAGTTPRTPARVLKNSLAVLVFMILAGVALQSLVKSGGSAPGSSALALKPDIAAQYHGLDEKISLCAHGLYILPKDIRSKARADVASYFRWKIVPPTKYYEPHPGIIDDRRIQQIVLADLEARETGCILFTDPFNESAKTPNSEKTFLEQQLEQRMTEILYQDDNVLLARIKSPVSGVR